MDNDYERYKKDMNVILDRASQDKEISKQNLDKVSTYIEQLNSYIYNDIELTDNAIYSKLKWMYEKLSFNFIYKLEEDILLKRARKYEEKNSSYYCFQNTDELSYIQNSDFAGRGRLNKNKEPMYYGVIYKSNFNEFDTELSEINARELDYINILVSQASQSLYTLYIGAFDLCIRGQKFPKWIHPKIKNNYKLFYSECYKKNNSYLLESHILCSAFFADILSRKNEDNLYKVTSILASMILENKDIDSIIYESVQVKGAPCIVIKPTAVDEKVKHIKAMSVKVVSNFGYGIYYADKLYNSEYIEKNGDIVWKEMSKIY